MSEEEILCSFCGRTKSQTKLLIAGLDAHICDICISQADMIVKDDETSKESNDFSVDLKPSPPCRPGNVATFRALLSSSKADVPIISQKHFHTRASCSRVYALDKLGGTTCIKWFDLGAAD